MTDHSNPTETTTDQLVPDFLQTVRPVIHAYSEEDAANKEQFHRTGVALLRQIARDLGYASGSYDVRSNKGGIAVSGEIILHSDDLYVQFSCSAFGSELQMMYRRCQHRRDYTGERNHFLPFEALRDYNQVITAFQALRSRPG